jgi:hypothetical protein
MNPLCVVCQAPATDVDHIQPIADGGEPWDMANMQALCHSHHSEKTRLEKAGASWEGTGADGYPISSSHWWKKNRPSDLSLDRVLGTSREFVRSGGIDRASLEKMPYRGKYGPCRGQ